MKWSSVTQCPAVALPWGHGMEWNRAEAKYVVQKRNTWCDEEEGQGSMHRTKQ